MIQHYFKCIKAASILSLALLSGQMNAQNPTSHDEASNYAEGEFTYGSGRGMGFVPWQLQGGSATSGFSLGSSTAVGLGNVNTDGQAFILYGYDGQGVSAARYFRGTGSIADPGDARSYLLPGQVFSVKIATGNGSGYKGINITTDNGSERLATFGIALGNYRFGSEDDGTFVIVNDEINPGTTSVFTVEAFQLTATTCEIRLTSDTGGMVTTGEKEGTIGGFSLYAGSTNSDSPQNRIYFNNLLVERRCPESTTWNGSAWSDGTPDITKTAIVASGTLTVSEDLEMCTLLVSGTANVVVATGVNLTVANVVNVAPTASMEVQNNANLIQIDNVQNTGKVKVYRNSSAIKRFDYTLWSSPVTGQNLFGFSPVTVANRFYTYTSATNLYSSIPDLGPESETAFAKGHGYLIRVSNNHPETPEVWEGEFEGLPNSGTVSVPMYTSNDPAFRYTLVGNPYPSAISIEKFVDRNSVNINGQLWFWRKTNNPASSSYSTVMANGDYVGNGDLADSEAYDPQGVIRTGQGFFVQASSSTPGSIIFNNSLREADNSNRFFRNAMDSESQPESNRFWLNISKDGDFYGQTLVNYRTGATMGIDYGMDGKARVNDGGVKLYSLSGENSLAIQARSLPFTTDDIVPLGFRSTEAGTLMIVLDKFDGLFAGQDIFLEDSYLGIRHNISDGGYSFITAAGTFNDRFRVVYAETLSSDNPAVTANSVIVYRQGNSIHINSANAEMESVSVYDMRGRLLSRQDNINAAENIITSLQAQQQVLIVKITTVNGASISKKIAY